MLGRPALSPRPPLPPPSSIAKAKGASFGPSVRPLGPGASNPHRAAPRIAYSVRGVLPTSALDHADGVALLEELDEDRYAQSSKAPKASHINTWVKLHVRWFGGDIPPLPLTVESVRAVAAQMKGAGYRSFPNYLDTMAHAHKKEHLWS